MNPSPKNQPPMAVSRHRSPRLIKSAWLIIWHGTNDVDIASLGRPRIVAILDCRLSENTISRYLNLLYYSDQNLSPSWKQEMYIQSPRRRRNIGLDNVASNSGVLSFGSFSPWLEAKRVSGLSIIVHNDDFETTCWTEKSSVGESIDFKLETTYSNSKFVEILVHGKDAV